MSTKLSVTLFASILSVLGCNNAQTDASQTLSGDAATKLVFSLQLKDETIVSYKKSKSKVHRCSPAVGSELRVVNVSNVDVAKQFVDIPINGAPDFYVAEAAPMVGTSVKKLLCPDADTSSFLLICANWKAIGKKPNGEVVESELCKFNQKAFLKSLEPTATPTVDVRQKKIPDSGTKLPDGSAENGGAKPTVTLKLFNGKVILKPIPEGSTAAPLASSTIAYCSVKAGSYVLKSQKVLAVDHYKVTLEAKPTSANIVNGIKIGGAVDPSQAACQGINYYIYRDSVDVGP